MKTNRLKILNANQAVAQIAYQTNEVFPIYPITPASEMSELVESWSAHEQVNALGTVPSTFEMQSEAGVAGAMHGALQTGSLSATFTSSQGLLLMLPNMFKIAGELSPNVIHVATRSIATHALSIFGDHSDIMAARQTGYAFLGSASVQEAHDFALIAQAATLNSRIPFVHFFDGFRTSHEMNTIEIIQQTCIKSMLDYKKIELHRNRSLDPNRPVIRGTAQGPDTFFQSREATNLQYDNCPNLVQEAMNKFAQLTGRTYKLFDYIGDPNAKHVIISMASSTETIEETILQFNKEGAQYGLIKVRLFRPFSTAHLLKALPKSVQSIAVLDRTKEPGSAGEPLYLDIVQSLMQAYQQELIPTLPKMVGGRYGLSSTDFNPSMVQAVFTNLKQPKPLTNFTIGIKDDLTNLSLNVGPIKLVTNQRYEAIFYDDNLASAESNTTHTLQSILNQDQKQAQGYIERDYKKSNSRNLAHIRFSDQTIKAPYLINQADFVGCQNLDFLNEDNAIDKVKAKGILLVNSSLDPQELWNQLLGAKQKQIHQKQLKLFVVDISQLNNMQDDIQTAAQGIYRCFLEMIKHTSFVSPFNSLIHKVNTKNQDKPTVARYTKDPFPNSLLGKLLYHKGDEIPVSLMPIDGTYETNTSWLIKPNNQKYIASWEADLCTQCGACSLACPQGAIELNVFGNEHLKKAPSQFKFAKAIDEDWQIDLLNYTLQIHPDQCTACHNCVDICPSNSINLAEKKAVITEAKENWNYAQVIPQIDRSQINSSKLNQQQLQESLFKYSTGINGCGEAPYLKLISQLYGDRMLIANATGASSIFGGALPTTPWSKNAAGLGPAWSNSLFEDNAEFGLGYRLSIDQQKGQARQFLQAMAPQLSQNLVHNILNCEQKSEEEINEQRLRIITLKRHLEALNNEQAKNLIDKLNYLIKKSVWIVGGDGWAYDIGYGGLDHALSSGKNINILVLDNEIYDNTGGQKSKATPFGATAKFSAKGKQTAKKDLGLMAMQYDHVFVASVAVGADQDQCLQAFQEAESYDGPSLIIAYSHSKSHGIDMKNPSQYQKAAVASGQWLLYRNDPKRTALGLNPLQLDSENPSIPIQDYLIKESRFNPLFEGDKLDILDTMEGLQEKVNKRFAKYSSLANQKIHGYQKSLLKSL